MRINAALVLVRRQQLIQKDGASVPEPLGRLLICLISKTIRHYSPELRERLNDLKDTRHASSSTSPTCRNYDAALKSMECTFKDELSLTVLKTDSNRNFEIIDSYAD